MIKLQEYADNYVNLALPEHGAAICSVTDDFFAPAKRMLSADEPIFIEGRFDAHGKWMDGWESRRKRVAGHDVCIIRICPGVIHGIEIDTRHFIGNYPPAISVEACRVKIEPGDETRWTELVAKADLQGDSRRVFAVDDKNRWTHIRLHIYPDGGIARLRIYGEPDQADQQAGRAQQLDLLSADVGGQAIACNNMHFGHMSNLLSMNPVANMGDGWETRRRRTAGNDWVILKLGRRGKISRVEVDTAFFRGNYPARCSLRGATLGDDESTRNSMDWPEILPKVALGPDQLHLFSNQLLAADDITHVRFDIYPDGGVARLRLYGEPTNPDDRD